MRCSKAGKGSRVRVVGKGIRVCRVGKWVKRKLARAFLSALLLTLCLVEGYSGVMAQTLVYDGEKYSGKYDLTAPHKVNAHLEESGYEEKVMKAFYQQLLAWGCTEEGACAVLGNCYRESSGYNDLTQGQIGWDDFEYGETGLGLLQWTYYTRQDMLFDTAAEAGKQWTDMAVQLNTFKKEWVDGDGIKNFKTSHDLSALVNEFCDNYENPDNNGEEYGIRYNYALEWQEKVKGLEAKEYDGVLSDSSSDGSSSGDKNVELSGGIISEWELTGMPAKSGLTADAVNLSFVSKDSEGLTAENRKDIAEIGTTIADTKTINAWVTVRVIIVFVGLLMFTYALMLLLALLFDKFNTIIDISLIGVLTLGMIKFSDDKYASNGEEDVIRTTDTKRMIILIVVMVLIGGVFVSGGVIPAVVRAIYRVTSVVTGSGS